MLGPFHNFVLLPDSEEGERIYREFWCRPVRGSDPPPDFRGFCRRHQGIRISDYLIAYMSDSLVWVPTEHPFPASRKWKEPWRGYGLDHYAQTAISVRGAPVLRRVCEAWADLFAIGPGSFMLRGPWVIEGDPRVVGRPHSQYEPQIENDDTSPRFTKGHFERLEYRREEVVPILRQLASHAEQASTGEFIVLHLGI